MLLDRTMVQQSTVKAGVAGVALWYVFVLLIRYFGSSLLSFFFMPFHCQGLPLMLCVWLRSGAPFFGSYADFTHYTILFFGSSVVAYVLVVLMAAPPFRLGGFRNVVIMTVAAMLCGMHALERRMRRWAWPSHVRVSLPCEDGAAISFFPGLYGVARMDLVGAFLLWGAAAGVVSSTRFCASASVGCRGTSNLTIRPLSSRRCWTVQRNTLAGRSVRPSVPPSLMGL